MFKPRNLDREEFLSTADSEPKRAKADEAPPFDFWEYFHSIPEPDFQGHTCSGRVEYVWHFDGRFTHVLVNSEDKNVFMVLVLDREASRVHGHRLLDLNVEYETNQGYSIDRR